MTKRCDSCFLPGTWRTCAVVLMCVFMAGCATIPADECVKVNWYTLGFEDGLKGYTADRISKHREACAPANVIPDERAYYSGRAEGLYEYCKPENAFVEGLAGREYRGVCLPPVDRVFARNHSAAYAVFKVRDNLRSVENRIDSKEKELRKKDRNDRERKDLRDEIRTLDEKRRDLRNELYRLEAELDRLRGNR
ncbi:MAG TPA: DUF2799 domain-containing protein [Dissulfurispiraceae bacterium]|nr:DUF2799 domain-containing protein [Dissulfurispiraceae bacterium]